MNYQVWTKDEYEGWKRVDCDGLEAVRAAVLVAIKGGKDPLVTVEVPFEVSIKIKEGEIGEATQSETKPNTVAGGASDECVRRGDPEPAHSPDKGNGVDQPGDRAGD